MRNMDQNVSNFYQLEAWQRGHELVLEIYKATRSFPKEELFGIVSQLRRAATSVTANVAEGFGRYHFNDKIRFYYQARGSVAEVQNFLLVSRDLGFLSARDCETLLILADSVRQLIHGLIRSIEKQQ